MSRQTIIDLAHEEVKNFTPPPNGELNKYLLWFGFRTPEEWCGVWCCWIYNQAGYPIEPIGYSRGFAGLDTALEYWTKNDKLTKDPLPGDLVIFSWHANGQPDHIGIFEKFINATTIQTIDGNTSLINQSNGGHVILKERNTSLVLCYVNPKGLPPDQNV